MPDSLASAQSGRGAQCRTGGGALLVVGHSNPGTPVTGAGGNTLDGGHPVVDTLVLDAAVNTSAARTHTSPVTDSPRGGARATFAHLLIFAEQVDDFERLRIATENRLRAMRDDHGMAGTPEFERVASTIELLARMEHDAVLNLQKAMRRHPLGPWVKRTVGVGEKQAARLLAVIGDPADRPNPGKLFQYAGHGDPARSKLRRGQPVEHNPAAKMRVHLIAESCIKQMHSPFRAVYDRERAKWADRPTTDMHKHNHALRVVGREVLKSLWREAREVAA